jgi:amino acid transporter
MASKSSINNTGAALGTFAGVFTPSVLTILGIILFLRLGYVVGSAGLGRALMILLLANGISVLTTFSLSAIATNLKVKGGGDYYLISRTLGPEFGASIGLVLYLAQSVSIAFYCIGFGEVVAGLLGSNLTFLPQIIAAAAVALLFILAWLGADWATRFQYVVMSILAVALISFFAGGLSHWDSELLTQNWNAPGSSPSFWVIFAIFFPAVTGFTQGVSMSGDLKDPGKSLPLGTFLAVGLSIVVYFFAAVVLAASLPQDVLIGDYGAMQKAAAVGFLITAGVVAATLSSAMASYLGAPRILQSLAADRILPFLHPLAKGFGPSANPRRGVLLSTAIAFATIALGKLNLIAPVVSMFFLISYGLLNYATYYEARAASPSFRPRFRWYDEKASLVGALACLGVMMAIDPLAGTVAIAVLFAIFQYVKRTAGPARWADSRRSYHLQRIRHHLLAAAAEPEHPRYWRPQILLFSDDTQRRYFLLGFAAWIQGESGFTTVVRILEGRGLKMLKQCEEAEAELRDDITNNKLEAFPLVISAPEINQSLQTLIQAFGIGPIGANTILLNWIETHSRRDGGYPEMLYGRNLRTAFHYGCNIILLDAKPDRWDALADLPPAERRIDVWWWGDATGRLMLLLAYLVTRNGAWEGAKIRVVAVGSKDRSQNSVEDLEKMLEEVRIAAEAQVVEEPDAEVVADESSDASLVFLPLRIRNNQPLDPFGGPLDETLFQLPVTALVMAAEDIDLDAEPEEGKAAEMASARDSVSDAQKRVHEAEKIFAKAATEVESIKEKLHVILADPQMHQREEKIADLMTDIITAEDRLNNARRRFAREKAKADDAARQAEALGAKPAEKDSDEDRKE